jgi:hypothetical protein
VQDPIDQLETVEDPLACRERDVRWRAIDSHILFAGGVRQGDDQLLGELRWIPDHLTHSMLHWSDDGRDDIAIGRFDRGLGDLVIV